MPKVFCCIEGRIPYNSGLAVPDTHEDFIQAQILDRFPHKYRERLDILRKEFKLRKADYVQSYSEKLVLEA